MYKEKDNIITCDRDGLISNFTMKSTKNTKEYKVTATLKSKATLYIHAHNKQEAKKQALQLGIIADLYDNLDNQQAKITVE